MLPGLAKLAFVSLVAVHAVIWSQSRYGHISGTASGLDVARSGLLKRYSPALGALDHFEEAECAPLSVPAADQCQHVLETCPSPDTFLSIPYLQHYFCGTPSTRPLIFAGLLVWLVFLFSTLGISASDFFCPNLATLADLLGLDENVAGVTFLAFGNGSPDVFSTFSAMRAGAGALAIGELLGAASFIVSVVVGSMCIVKPFTVARRPFLRDVGFFTTAVALLLVILWDGEIHVWEAGLLVALYVVYVFVVVLGSWWERRQARRYQRELTVRSEYADDELLVTEPYRDDPSPTLAVPSPSPRVRAHSSPAAAPALALDTTHIASHPHSRYRSTSTSHSGHSLSPAATHSRASSQSTPRIAQMPSFSLVGALEFRQVVAGLRSNSTGAGLAAFDSPVTPYVGGHYHTHSHSSYSSHRADLVRRHSGQSVHSGHSRRSSYSSQATQQDPWDAALGVPLHARSPRTQALALQDADADARSAPPNLVPHAHSPNENGGGTTADQLFPRTPSGGIPFISTTPASPASDTASVDVQTLAYAGSGRDREPLQKTNMTTRHRFAHAARHTLHVLFPTLHDFRGKSWLGAIASVLAAPAVLALTLTLPVHVTPRGPPGADEKPINGGDAYANGHRHGADYDADYDYERAHGAAEGRLVEFEEDGVARVLTAEDDVRAELAGHELRFNKWLMAAQVFLGPVFCAAVLFSGMDGTQELFLLVGTAIASGAAAALVLVFADRGNDPVAQMARCFMGFFVAVVWIMAIADEVVNVLKTFGFIFGLSDAIIGLTVFAVGNSLADFVANLAVAQFAPVMGFSACFGGPMLNILLGVGGSGSYILHTAGAGAPYVVHFSTTLLVSTIGLLSLLVATMVFVPWNGFHLPKRWGVFLIVWYIIIMTTNVIVEIKR